jgi:outer membrane protein
MRSPVLNLKLTAGRARMGLACVFLLGFASTVAAQGPKATLDLSQNPEWFPRFYKPYVSQKLPKIDLANSPVLMDMVRGGKIRISLAQLRTSVDENNLDILSSRNSSYYAQTDMLRVKGGGAPRGGAGVTIPSSLFAGAIGAGVGGSGGLGSFSGVGGITGGARQVFGVTRGSYDPSFALGFSVDRTDSPLNSIIVSGLPEVITSSIALQTRFSQAFPMGSSFSVGFNNMRQRTNQEYLKYNPVAVSQLTISVTQNLLSGFGNSIGKRFIDVGKNEQRIMKEIVRLQVNTTLAQAQNTYWDLVAARDNFRVAEQTLAVARQLLENNKKKEEIGTASGLDVTTAASEVAARERDLVTAQATLQMREVDLKNVISKNMSDLLGPVQIEPADVLPDPKETDIPKITDALETAMRNRSEIIQAEVNLQTQDIAIKYEKDLLKPTLLFFANFNSSGLYGTRTITDPTSGARVVLPGGIWGAMGLVRRWTYPEYAIGFSFSLNIRNRAAEADAYRSKLERQQTEITLQRTRNSIALEVRKSLIGLVQSKAQVEAAQKAAKLTGETLAAEEAKLMEGSSIPYEVIRRQRDYVVAQVAEVQARANYAKALVERDRAMGVLEPKK